MSAEEEGQKLKRTTVRMPDFLYDRVAQMAVEERRSLNQLIIEILFDYISGPTTAFREANRNQLLGMNVGALLAIDASRIDAPGLSHEQKQEVIYGIIEYLRSKRDDEIAE